MHSWHFTLECFAKIQNPSRTISDFCTKSVLFIASVHDVKTSEVSKAEIYSNHKSADRQGQLRYQFNFFFNVPFAVPEKVWSLQEREKKANPNVVDLNKKQNDDDLWWNQATLTHLDLSSNVLTEISGKIRNLTDLTVLNVSSERESF